MCERRSGSSAETEQYEQRKTQNRVKVQLQVYINVTGRVFFVSLYSFETNKVDSIDPGVGKPRLGQDGGGGRHEWEPGRVAAVSSCKED